MQMEKRTLYNLLRMHWLLDPTISVESWQVTDYRALPLEELFQRLSDAEIVLDRVSFLALADDAETPEELTDQLLAGLEIDAKKTDQIYLLIFEIWRRLVPDKLCISVFSDELDHRVQRYDNGQLESVEDVQDILGYLAIILDDSADNSRDPKQAFVGISNWCANDIECFIYEFIADQIDGKNFSYASELLEEFTPYMTDPKWFELLNARLYTFSDIPQANALIAKLVKQIGSDSDLEFNLEALSCLAQGGDPTLFRFLVKQTVPLLKTEDDFQDLLAISADYLEYINQDHAEEMVQAIIQERFSIPLEKPLDLSTHHVHKLLTLLQ